MGVGVCAQIIEVSCKNPGARVQLCQPGTLICPSVWVCEPVDGLILLFSSGCRDSLKNLEF